MRYKTLVLLGMLVAAASSLDLAGDDRKLADQSYLCGRTLLEMRSVGAAISEYLRDNPTLPEILTSIDQLRPLIEPMYIRSAVLEDAWGEPLRLIVGADRKSFRLVSSGSDREFDESTWSRAGSFTNSTEDCVISSSGAENREWVIQ